MYYVLMAAFNANSNVNVNYNAYDELMQYFGFEFIVQVALATMVFIVFLKTMLRAYAVVFKVKLNQKIPLEVGPLEWVQSSFDILVSAIGVMGLISAMVFQGVMSDIPLESGHIWADKTLIIFIMALSMFVLQVVATIYVSMRRRG